MSYRLFLFNSTSSLEFPYSDMKCWKKSYNSYRRQKRVLHLLPLDTYIYINTCTVTYLNPLAVGCCGFFFLFVCFVFLVFFFFFFGGGGGGYPLKFCGGGKHLWIMQVSSYQTKKTIFPTLIISIIDLCHKAWVIHIYILWEVSSHDHLFVCIKVMWKRITDFLSKTSKIPH